MYKLGLKLWSINKNYIKPAQKLYEKKLFDYIELFAVPNSYNEYINLWKSLDIPYVIHAPHFTVGLNLAKKEMLNSNLLLAAEAIKYADKLAAKFIIFHPGIDGDLNQTVFQLNKINDPRILIENKPYFTNDKKFICNGYSPQDIEFVLKMTNLGFCFDIGHAICSANAQNIEPFDYLLKFNNLKPKMYHLSDGKGLMDDHLHLGAGMFDLGKIINFILPNSLISLETEKKFSDNLDDFEQDIWYFRNLMK